MSHKEERPAYFYFCLKKGKTVEHTGTYVYLPGKLGTVDRYRSWKEIHHPWHGSCRRIGSRKGAYVKLM